VTTIIRQELNALRRRLDRNAEHLFDVRLSIANTESEDRKADWMPRLDRLVDFEKATLARMLELETQLGIVVDGITINGVTYRKDDHVQVNHHNLAWCGFITKIISDPDTSFKQIVVMRQGSPYDLGWFSTAGVIDICLSKPVKECTCYSCTHE
jgi:hypothetical protein